MYPCAVERESAVPTACCHAVSVGGEEQTARQGQHRVCQKFIQDSLVKEKVLENDGWTQIESWTDAFTVDAQCPRVEVELEEV